MIKHLFFLHEQGKRNNLEDCLYPFPGNATVKDRVFLVCDGVGGEEKGEIASQIVCEEMGKQLSRLKSFTKDAIQRAGSVAVGRLRSYARYRPEASRMSTTVTVACLDATGAWVAWCGDSRVYHIRNGITLWKSKDHSYVQSLIDIGELKEEEAKYHERCNEISKSFSAADDSVDLEFHHLDDIRPGDYLLLCTDGLLELVNEALLYQALNPDQPERNKSALLNQYCFENTSDNYSMYLLELGFSTVPG